MNKYQYTGKYSIYHLKVKQSASPVQRAMNYFSRLSLMTKLVQVENLVVGAPCGIMDQMASVLGGKDSLLALRCQPAEVSMLTHHLSPSK